MFVVFDGTKSGSGEGKGEGEGEAESALSTQGGDVVCRRMVQISPLSR